MEDVQIIELFFERSEQALRETEKKYGALCFTVANNILRSAPDSEECVNDTYFAAWNSIPPEKPAKLRAYLAKITRNKALNRYAHNKSARRSSELSVLLSELSEDIPERGRTDDMLNSHYVTDIINKWLHTVPKNKAAMFVQRYFLCYSLDEISNISGCSYNKVATTLHRMRLELKEKLREEGVEV